MDVNANSFINRIKITFYSWLISGGSLLNRVHTNSKQLVNSPILSHPFEDELLSLPIQDTVEISLANRWSNIAQVLVPFIIWMVLGFAAGFLIGIVIPG